jgi:hypothetical protein
VTDPDLIGLFIAPLERLEFPYMITGGVASIIYGDPRFTRDVDIVLDLRAADVDAFAHGFQHGRYYVPPLDVLQQETARPLGGHFNVIHADTGLKADIYVSGDDPLHAWAFGRRLRTPIEDIAIWIAPVEYVILRKLQYFQLSRSDRHIRDVAMILRISGDIIDFPELDVWIEKLELRKEMDLAFGYTPE